jgi:tRNA(fMet)-specific endonuclease VapC
VIYLLDITALSAAMRHEEAMISFLTARRPGEITTASPVAGEIEYGIQRLAHDSRQFDLLNIQKEKLFSLIEILPWNRNAAVRFGKIKADLEQKGKTADDIDIATAAIALENNAEIITANIVQFRQFPNLISRHWAE